MWKALAAAAVVLPAASLIAWSVSPWPSALLYRHLMDRGGVALNAGLARHVPPGVTAETDIPYATVDPDARLDVYRPAAAGGAPLPAIVWTHGGAFISGDKSQVANYLRILAHEGYVTVGVGYTLAPRAGYPGPVRQLAAALAYLRTNARRHGIDPARIVLAGDSAGAQIAAQMTAIIASGDYAARVGIAAPIPRESLRAAILHCGFHDPHDIRAGGSFGGFLDTVVWSYLGVRDLASDPRTADFSIVRNVSREFPPLFVSAGNADPLLPHSRTLVERARAQGVTVDALFFPGDHAPPLSHEYQFDLDGAAGREALARTRAFLARHLPPAATVDGRSDDPSTGR